MAVYNIKYDSKGKVTSIKKDVAKTKSFNESIKKNKSSSSSSSSSSKSSSSSSSKVEPSIKKIYVPGKEYTVTKSTGEKIIKNMPGKTYKVTPETYKKYNESKKQTELINKYAQEDISKYTNKDLSNKGLNIKSISQLGEIQKEQQKYINEQERIQNLKLNRIKTIEQRFKLPLTMTAQERKNYLIELNKMGVSSYYTTKLFTDRELSPQALKKVKDVDYSIVFKKISDKKSGLRAVDKITFEKAYKTTINQELKKGGLNPVKLNAPIKTYQDKYKIYLDKIKFNKKNTYQELEKNLNKNIILNKLQKQVILNVSKDLKKITFSPQYLRTTKQTLTPKQTRELKKFDETLLKNNTKLVLNELWDVPKYTFEFSVEGIVGILTIAQYTGEFLGKSVYYLQTKAIPNTYNNITNYLNSRKKILFKSINRKKYISSESEITKVLKKDMSNIWRESKQTLKKYWEWKEEFKKNTSFNFGDKKNSFKYQRALTQIVSIIAVTQMERIGEEFIKSPGKVLGSVLSFLFEGEVLSIAAIRSLQLEAKYSPLVLKNIKILEASASERITAKALQKLEGKTVDLWHTTKIKTKEMFKGTDISKKELDFLVTEMKRNPELFITRNNKIKSLKEIALGSAKKNMLEFAKNTKNIILTGSASLKLQLNKFRKIGDLDFISSNAKKTADEMADYLNKNSLLGRMIKDRFKVHHNKGTTTYQIYDNLKARLYKTLSKPSLKKILDYKKFAIADIKQAERGINEYKTIKIKGIKVYDVAEQLSIKTIVSQDPNFISRMAKEIKDIKLIAGKKLNKSKLSLFKKLVKEKPVLRVRMGDPGVERAWYWVGQYFPNEKIPFGAKPETARKWKKQMIKKLKKIGFTDQQILRNNKLHQEVDMYFAPNIIYQHYLRGGEGYNGIIFIPNQKITPYGKELQKLLYKNELGKLSTKEKINMRRLMKEYREKNIDKVFLSPKTLTDGFGEKEVLLPIYSRVFKKPQLMKRKVYFPSLYKFAEVQESTLGKLQKTKLRKLYEKFARKLKKGYSTKEMKKDILNYAKKTKTKIKKTSEKYLTSKGRKKQVSVKKRKETLKIKQKLKEEKELKKELEFLKKERERIKNDKNLTTKERNRQLKRITPSKRIKTQLRLLKQFIRKVTPRKTTPRKTIPRKTTLRKVTIRKTIPRKTTPRKVTPRKTTLRKITPRKPTPRKTIPRKTIPRKTIPRKTIPRKTIPRKTIPRKTIPRVMTFRNEDYFKKKGLRFKYNVQYHERRNKNIPYNKKTNPRIKKIIKLELPYRKALKKILNKIDKDPTQRMKLFITGLTKQKDDKKITSLIRKFEIAKNKDGRSFELQEKKKYLIDSIGEKKGLRLSKLQKKSKLTPTKRVSKVKSIKKKKKSSQNRSK